MTRSSRRDAEFTPEQLKDADTALDLYATKYHGTIYIGCRPRGSRSADCMASEIINDAAVLHSSLRDMRPRRLRQLVRQRLETRMRADTLTVEKFGGGMIARFVGYKAVTTQLWATEPALVTAGTSSRDGRRGHTRWPVRAAFA